MFYKGNAMLLAVALVIGAIAVVIARLLLAPASASANTIVVAAAPLGFGTQITADNVIEIPWELGNIPEGAFINKQALLKSGRRDVLRPLARNEPILATKITAPGQRGSLASLIDEGKRAVTVRVDDVRGVAGFVLPGDRVDVVLIRTDGHNQSYSDIILERAEVLAIDQLAGERAERPTVAKAVTLQATPEDAQKVLLASTVGKISLILREGGESNGAGARRVSEQDLLHDLPTGSVPPEGAMTNVAIVRGTKSQDYSVVRDARH